MWPVLASSHWKKHSVNSAAWQRARDTGSIYLTPYETYGGMIQVKLWIAGLQKINNNKVKGIHQIGFKPLCLQNLDLRRALVGARHQGAGIRYQ